MPRTGASPEEQALRADILQYDNPEAFYDSTIPPLYKLSIVSYLLPDNPSVIRAEIDGNLLPSALIEQFFWTMSQDPREFSPSEGVRNFAEFRLKVESEPDFESIVDSAWQFFIRYFPKLLVSTFSIAVLSACTAAVLAHARRQPDEDSRPVRAVG